MSKNKKNKKGLFEKNMPLEPPVPFVPIDDTERRIADLERTVSVLVQVVSGTLEPLQSWHPQQAIEALKRTAKENPWKDMQNMEKK